MRSTATAATPRWRLVSLDLTAAPGSPGVPGSPPLGARGRWRVPRLRCASTSWPVYVRVCASNSSVARDRAITRSRFASGSRGRSVGPRRCPAVRPTTQTSTWSKRNRRAMKRATCRAHPPARDEQDVARQIEEPRDLITPRPRVGSLPPRRRREIAGHDAHADEHEQRDPVLRIGNREGAHGRQEEEVQTERRRDREQDRDPQRRQRRRGKHDHQVVSTTMAEFEMPAAR